MLTKSSDFLRMPEKWRPAPAHRGQRTNISHSETVGREGGTRFLEPNLAFAYFDIISSFWIKKTCTHTPTVFCCIPMAVCHRWSRYLPIYISFARGMLKVTTTYARRMCWPPVTPAKSTHPPSIGRCYLCRVPPSRPTVSEWDIFVGWPLCPSPGTEEGLARTVSMMWTRSSFLTLLIKISNLWYNIKVYYTFSVKSGMLSSNLVFTEAQNPLALDCVAASACMPAWSTHKHGADHAVCGPILSTHNILWSRKTTHNLCPNIEHEVDLT